MKTMKMKQDRNTDAYNLRLYLFEHELTQAQLAARLECSQSYVSQMITGRTTMSHRIRERLADLWFEDI
jgi:transcriptional regulator with XRE-family HTH domain